MISSVISVIGVIGVLLTYFFNVSSDTVNDTVNGTSKKELSKKSYKKESVSEYTHAIFQTVVGHLNTISKIVA